ncbi:MAG TPA: UDP-4-amino-4,6-dideoxy-N-acetyl-beta-L-altrosamine N-acetyltransferase [Phenylobacterium sp.]|nr:UDP-4-amino-4,6-dideoxy-N-acetyl-beta-L-altrosamine N-acetyltransferase [Phenylobacterium sp.]
MPQPVDARLRPATQADAARMLDWRNQPQVARWMYSDHLITPQEHARFMATALTDPARRYWIVELDGAPVGLAGLVDISAQNRKATLVHYLADPATRGRGLGAFVEVWLLDQTFRELGLNKLCCEVMFENERAWRMHEGFGFTREAFYRAHVWKAGRPCDVVGLAILADEWAALRPASVERLRARGFAIGD